MGIDALFKRGGEVIYTRPGAATAMHVAPLLGRARKGVLLSVEF